MKIINGKVIPEYHPQMVINIRAFMDRVPVKGVEEARELAKCADILEAIVAGHYVVTNALASAQGDGSGSSL